ncbi:hypothetical protein [Curtobacterium sp. MCJR17_043]|uniref:GHMP family kinase ATP-binding protein n=1 Tax=Curtobacterium sp. MCJR17_043 TaxID=2175660 RepID=UPI0024DFC72A|nr:hypothetical protein [Curtobacterium sp. MCJR17_043]WIB35628.1 hypothetical protein DEJ15_15960 [Curtobacterium sp. MCJR17_043]
MTSNHPATAPTTTTAIPRVGSSVSHGKTILIGEHAVVYGAPALVLPVTDVRVTATATPLPATHSSGAEHVLESSVHTGPFGLAPAAVLPTTTAVTATLRHLADLGYPHAVDTAFHVRVDSQVPTARGMGSSAAVAAAVTAAVADALGGRARPRHPPRPHPGVRARRPRAPVRTRRPGGSSPTSPSGSSTTSSSRCNSPGASSSSSPTPVSPDTRARPSRPSGNATTAPPEVVDAVVQRIGDLARAARGDARRRRRPGPRCHHGRRARTAHHPRRVERGPRSARRRRTQRGRPRREAHRRGDGADASWPSPPTTSTPPAS